MSTPKRVPAHIGKHVRLQEFVEWASVVFRSEEARDRFLSAAATLPANDVEVEPMPDENRGAMVRWRPGKFLGLNDLAYAHGGQIVPAQRRGS